MNGRIPSASRFDDWLHCSLVSMNKEHERKHEAFTIKKSTLISADCNHPFLDHTNPG